MGVFIFTTPLLRPKEDHGSSRERAAAAAAAGAGGIDGAAVRAAGARFPGRARGALAATSARGARENATVSILAKIAERCVCVCLECLLGRTRLRGRDGGDSVQGKGYIHGEAEAAVLSLLRATALLCRTDVVCFQWQCQPRHFCWPA